MQKAAEESVVIYKQLLTDGRRGFTLFVKT